MGPFKPVRYGFGSRDGERPRRAGRMVTYAGHDEHDDEGVGHGDDRRGQGGDDALERLDLAEEPHDPYGAQHADHVDVEVALAEGGEGEEDDDHVDEVPPAADEGAEPVA